MIYSEVYVPSSSLWGRELGQQVHMLWLFSQDSLKGSRARRRHWCRNVAWLHLAWAGVYFPPYPHPPTWSCTYARLFWPTCRAVLVACNSLTSLGVWGPGLPPHPSIGSRTRATICQYNFQFSIMISNLNVKLEFQTADRHVGYVQNHITGTSKCNLFQTLYHWHLFQLHLSHRYYVCVHN
jgi:hypothetical protein